MEYINENNTIYIIGNGFDLAHNLNTSYLDFITDWVVKERNLSVNFDWFRDVVSTDPNNQYIKDVISYLNNNFLSFIMSEYNTFKWMDIEHSYFKKLYSIIKTNAVEKDIYDEINKLNIDFEYVKMKLYNYISSIDNTINSSIIKKIEKKFIETKSLSRNFAINFNYTKTILNYRSDMYVNRTDSDFEIIHINGKVYKSENNNNYNDHYNNIVFGFGDEYSDSFNTIKEYHTALKYYKSIEYSIRPEFSRINEILTEPYNLVIMGHSCGISDRTLLSMLTNNKNLRKIVIYCADRNDNYERLLYLKQSTENGRIFKVTEIDKGLCE